MTPARRAALERAQASRVGRFGFEVLGRMDPDLGFWSWASSPHVLWLASQLNHVCWLPSEAPNK
jgi:hypothetical protein